MARNRCRGYLAAQACINAETHIVNTIDNHQERLADDKIRKQANERPNHHIVKRSLA